MTSDRNPKPIKSKKSETLEVRIPFETKQAFLTACREDGTTASEVVRESVQTYLDERERPPIQEKRTLVMKLPQPVRHYGPRIAAGSIAAIGLATFVALPSAAAPDFKAQFNQMDANSDGVLSADEFLGSAKPASGEEKNIVIETRKVVRQGDPADAARADWTPQVKQEAFAYSLPDELRSDKTEEKHQEFRFITRSETKTSDDADAGKSAEETFTFSINDFRQNEFDTIDADKDGKVSLVEYQTHQRKLFTRGFEMLDRDGDKSLNMDEYAKIAAAPVIHLNDDPDSSPPEIHIDGPKASPEALSAAFTRLDANKDGKLSLQEYLPQT